MSLLTRKELAFELKRSAPYVRAMERKGFKTSSGRATLEEARRWLEKHPKPLSKRK